MKRIKFFILRNKDRILRFLISFSIVICVFLSSLTASAASVIPFVCAKPTVTDNSGYIEISYDGYYYVFVVFGTYTDTSTDIIESNMLQAVYNGSDQLAISYYVGSNSSNSFTRCFGYWIRNDGKIWSTSCDSDGVIRIGIGTPTSRQLCRFYGIQPKNSEFDGGMNDIIYSYGENTVINDNISLCQSLLSQINVTSSSQLDKLETIINSLMLSNTQLQHIDEKILGIWYDTDSIDYNLNRVIQILEAAENGAYYNPSNDGTAGAVTNQQQKDEQVFAGTETGRVEASNSITGLSGLLTTTGAVFKGSTAITKVFNLFAQSSFLAPILQISLVLGISSFVLGTAFIVVGKIRNKKE